MKPRGVSDDGESNMSGGRSRALMKQIGDELISQAYMEAVKQHTLLTPEREIELGKVIEPIIDVRKDIQIITELLVKCDLENKEFFLSARERLEQKELGIFQSAWFQDARNELITHNLRWVFAVAKRFRNKGLPFKDVIQEGNLGLMMAAEKYEWRRGFRFTTYSHWWIRQGITRAIMDDGAVVRLPSYIGESLPAVMASREAFITEHGCEPTYEELAMRCDQTAVRIKTILTAGNRIISLESPAKDDPDFSLHDVLPCVNEPYEDIIFAKEWERALPMLLGILTPIEREIIERRFGMNGYAEEQVLREIGELKGVSHECVRQIAKRAFDKLRALGNKKEFRGYGDR